MGPLGSRDERMKSTYSRGHDLLSGETVTKGRFRCTQCGYEHEVREGVKNLPVCPRCQGEAWELA